ncbi:MAG TPA: NAD(P) transhydrogenase subunit alpha [bacterium]|nr:NAD(P) transhydrogenase subunit alpha [bacterium]
MIIGVAAETRTGERRVALVPSTVPVLTKAGHQVVVQAGAGAAAGFPDGVYAEHGARVVPARDEVFAAADAVVQVLCYSTANEPGRRDLGALRRGQVLAGLMDPLASPETVPAIAATGAAAFAMELVPRITRAQSMDALSAMATVGGYKAVLLAADALPRMFPMLTTAAGTITPARVFVIGAGVMGLQAIATARRLGATVSAYDVRPAAREEAISVGARFVELPLDTAQTQDTRGYARSQDESFYRRQRELLARTVAQSDVVITTAAVPGKRAPVLVTAEMVAAMPPGSVIVDCAADHGGNCESSHPGETAQVGGVTIVAPLQLPGLVPTHASQLYGRTLAAFLLHMSAGKELKIDPADEIVRETLVTHGGEIVQPRVRDALGLPSLTAPAAPSGGVRAPATPPASGNGGGA